MVFQESLEQLTELTYIHNPQVKMRLITWIEKVFIQLSYKLYVAMTDYCGWPGRVNDARVFRNSKVCQCQALLCRPNHLVGDEAYPLSSYLIKPYRERQNMIAAKKLCSARAVIEHAFSVLKGRYRRPQHHKHGWYWIHCENCCCHMYVA